MKPKHFRSVDPPNSCANCRYKLHVTPMSKLPNFKETSCGKFKFKIIPERFLLDATPDGEATICNDWAERLK